MRRVETPLYESPPTGKSNGNAYAIYADRIELRCRFPFITKTIVVLRDDLVSIDVCKPPVIRTTFWALKLDLPDLNPHVRLIRKRGGVKQLRFSPVDPEAFVAAARKIFFD